MKAEWVYVIIKALEARLEYVGEDDAAPQDEEAVLKEALEYFKAAKIRENENGA